MNAPASVAAVDPAAARRPALLLDVQALAVAPRSARERSLLEGVSLDLPRGGALGIVGESGSGKSLTCLSILDLLPPALVRTAGRIVVDGSAIGEGATGGAFRGRRAAMLFQDPAAALNPLRRVGRFLTDLLRLHRGLRGRAAEAEALRLLDCVGLAGAPERMRAYPHQLSGGQNQRVMIAGALASEPELLLADEPTTALDVTTQAQILDLLAGLRRDRGMGLVIVSHDLGVIARAAETVAVMYAGRIVEAGPVDALFRRPRHPYTAGLLASLPPETDRRPLTPMSGQPASGGAVRDACAFAARCPRATSHCARALPPLIGDGERDVACHHPLPA